MRNAAIGNRQNIFQYHYRRASHPKRLEVERNGQKCAVSRVNYISAGNIPCERSAAKQCPRLRFSDNLNVNLSVVEGCDIARLNGVQHCLAARKELRMNMTEPTFLRIKRCQDLRRSAFSGN